MSIIYIADRNLKNKLCGINMKDESGTDIIWECFPVLTEADDHILMENDMIQNPIDRDNTRDCTKTIRNENEIIYTARSGFTWSSIQKQAIPHISKTIEGKVMNRGRNVVSIENAFKLFINNEIITQIVNETNKFCQTRLQNVPIVGKPHEMITTTEINAFFAILLIGGLKCKDIIQFAAIWDEAEPNSRQFHTITMARHRFFYIYGNIQFDSPFPRREGHFNPRGAYEPVRSIIEIFRTSCGLNYFPGKDINVGKRLAEYSGRCPFRVQENPAAQPGIRLWVAADAKSLYISNIYVEMGKNKDIREEIDRGNIVKKLVSSFYGSGRGITTHSSLTSIELAHDLLLNNLKMTGILTLNRKDIPKDLTTPIGRIVGSNICIYNQNLSLISYCVLSNRLLTFLSTENQSLCEPAEYGGKLKIVQHQLETNGAVRRGITMTKNSSCVKETGSWSFRVFMEILDIAVLNAFVIWLANYPRSFDVNPIGLRHFIADLATQLALDNINQREKKLVQQQQDSTLSTCKTALFRVIGFRPVNEMVRHLPLEQQRMLHQNIPLELVYDSVPIPTTSNFEGRRIARCDSTVSVESCDSTTDEVSGRCDFCPLGRERKTRMVCVTCRRKVCNSHRHIMNESFCFECTQNNNEE